MNFQPLVPRSAARRAVAGALIFAALVAAVHLARRGQWLGGRDIPDYRRKGPASAPVRLTEFSDFQCPNCAKAQPFLKDLADRHAGELSLAFRHLPLTRIHKWSLLAAKAAECAGLQGRFWEYHDRLFASQKEWATAEDAKPLFRKYAEELGLDRGRFEADLADPAVDRLIEEDRLEAKAQDVSVTPTFFINGRRAVGDTQLRAYGERFIELGKRP